MYIRKQFNDIKMRQFELMAHAIGFRRELIKYNKYKCYRNHFTISETDCSSTRADLEYLVEKGLMKSRLLERQIVYHVTEWGFILFAEVFDCKIQKE